ncbi:MAG: hypothetical protein JXJ04_05110, partial [Spirochaetales bacterium]|nr:hypothetical protein [Spirochaetales bacterium]
MNNCVKKSLFILLFLSFFLFSGCPLVEYLLGTITITSPDDQAIVATSSVRISVDASYNYIDYITVEIDGQEVYSSTESNFSFTANLDPGWNTIVALCYAYDNEDDHFSSYVGSDSIDVYYDAYDPEITITSPENWSILDSNDVTITGNIYDYDNLGFFSFTYLENGTYHSLSYDGNGDWSL